MPLVRAGTNIDFWSGPQHFRMLSWLLTVLFCSAVFEFVKAISSGRPFFTGQRRAYARANIDLNLSVCKIEFGSWNCRDLRPRVLRIFQQLPGSSGLIKFYTEVRVYFSLIRELIVFAYNSISSMQIKMCHEQ